MTNIRQRYNPRVGQKSRPEPLTRSPESVESLWSAHNCSIQQLDELRTQLDEARSQKSRTPAHLRGQTEDKDQEIHRLQNAVFSLQLTLREQEEALRQKDIRINQQAATIQIHSEEIAKTNRRTPKFESTPIRLPSQAGAPNRYPSQGMPPICDQSNQPQIDAATHYKTKWGNIPHEALSRDVHTIGSHRNETLESYQPSTYHSSQRMRRKDVEDFGSPIPLGRLESLNLGQHAHGITQSPLTTPPRGSQPSGSAGNSRLTPVTSHGSGQVPIPPVPPQTPERSDSVVSKPRSMKQAAMVVGVSSASKQAMSTRAFSELFDHVVEFAYAYANVPSTQADSNLPQELKQRLMSAATKTTAHKIMSSQFTRYLLVAKIIIMWIQSNVFQEGSFAGLDKAIDDVVVATRKKIFNNTPAPVRFVFLHDIANQFVQLGKAPNYEDFFTSMTHRRASELWSIIRPLMYHKVEGDWENMHNLMQEAHKVAEMQRTETAEFRLFFPKIHDPFNDASMINMDPEFDHMAPDEIMARRASVRLGAIPQVMARITSPDGNIVTKTLTKAGVLLKVGDSKK